MSYKLQREFGVNKTGRNGPLRNVSSLKVIQKRRAPEVYMNFHKPISVGCINYPHNFSCIRCQDSAKKLSREPTERKYSTESNFYHDYFTFYIGFKKQN